MARSRKKMAPPRLEKTCYPTAVVELARAFQGGKDCGFALHDALLEAGEPDLADHFQGSCLPGERCVVVESLIDPVAFLSEDGEPHPSALRFCLDIHLQGAVLLWADYHGSGDSGGVEEYHVEGPDRAELDCDWNAFAKVRKYQAYAEAAPSMRTVVDRLVSPFCLPGYEINEGSHGTFTFNVKEGTGQLEHTWHEYEPVDPDGDPEDEDYEVETVDGARIERVFDFLRPEVVSRLEAFTQVKNSSAGPGYISLGKRGKKIVPVIGLWQGQGDQKQYVEEEITWAVLADGRIYDPKGIYKTMRRRKAKNQGPSR